jgi:peptidoglycan/xylan/chitin deacetylase (PgdA/CDA1 family)
MLSSILRHAVYPILSKTRYFSSRAEASVVTYHGVLPEGYRVVDPFLDNTLITIECFRAQLRMLKQHYNVISPDRFRAWLQGTEDLPERAVLITCDDGLLNNLTVMAGVLKEEGLQCMFFAIGLSLEPAPKMLWYVELYLMLMACRTQTLPFEWNGVEVPAIESEPEMRRAQWLRFIADLSPFDALQRAEFLQKAQHCWELASDWRTQYLNDPLLSQRFQVLSAADVRHLADAGMTIGAHTLSHPELCRQAEELARREIGDCRSKLANCTGRAVWSLAYPFGNPGAVAEREFRLAQEAGYECAFMNISGKVAECNRFTLPRVHVTADMSLEVYEAHVSGFHESLRRKLGHQNPITPAIRNVTERYS